MTALAVSFNGELAGSSSNEALFLSVLKKRLYISHVPSGEDKEVLFSVAFENLVERVASTSSINQVRFPARFQFVDDLSTEFQFAL